ncbi:phosphotransferase [Paenibacillus sp. YN15]|uniref:phosphotransferase n=1 Tax=Paenibacillus sp. YN15 TaxID=1742774 RepID=UPI000DCCD15B|nr:phosphotransferase [Paenibacillus sp. YN15]RAU90973.1 aminoglycoside phosphotransferase [Paenibacillus sp. YN15]
MMAEKAGRLEEGARIQAENAMNNGTQGIGKRVEPGEKRAEPWENDGGRVDTVTEVRLSAQEAGLTATETLAHEAAKRFCGQEDYCLEDCGGGTNNTTGLLTSGGKKYMLRLYNTHEEREKAEFEHRLLEALGRLAPGLPFGVPQPAEGAAGTSLIRLAGGKLAAMFRYLDGVTPDFGRPAQAEAFGRAAGELSRALERLEQQEQLEAAGLDLPAYPPYYALASAHPSCGLDEVSRFCGEPPEEFAGCREALLVLGRQLEELAPVLDGLAVLPHQLIHGDLNASNALVAGDGEIAALLDFEFVTRDLRAMEPAVCLWGLLPEAGADAAGTAQTWACLKAFWRGFAAVRLLSAEERRVIPELMQLRSLDVFLHFLGRYRDGVDDASMLLRQIPDTASRLEQVERHRRELEALLELQEEALDKSVLRHSTDG